MNLATPFALLLRDPHKARRDPPPEKLGNLDITWQLPKNRDVFNPILGNFRKIAMGWQIYSFNRLISLQSCDPVKTFVVDAVSLWFKTLKSARKLEPLCTTANANHP
jgi:hypothetical protein